MQAEILEKKEHKKLGILLKVKDQNGKVLDLVGVPPYKIKNFLQAKRKNKYFNKSLRKHAAI